jgi:hypothetical protein
MARVPSLPRTRTAGATNICRRRSFRLSRLRHCSVVRERLRPAASRHLPLPLHRRVLTRQFPRCRRHSADPRRRGCVTWQRWFHAVEKARRAAPTPRWLGEASALCAVGLDWRSFSWRSESACARLRRRWPISPSSSLQPSSPGLPLLVECSRLASACCAWESVCWLGVAGRPPVRSTERRGTPGDLALSSIPGP